MKLDHLLKSQGRPDFPLFDLRSDELKKACRAWVGKEAYSFNKERCLAALQKAFRDETAGRRVLADLTDQQRQVLAIVARYGWSISGSLLTAEAYARGLRVRDKDGERPAYFAARRDDPVFALCEKLVLRKTGSYWDSYDSSGKRYPSVAAHPELLKLIAPAPPLPWKGSPEWREPGSAQARLPAHPALELEQVASALEAMGSWALLAGGTPAKSARARLQKQAGSLAAAQDAPPLPDAEGFYYELLRGLGVLTLPEGNPRLSREHLEEHLRQPGVVQAWRHVRAWLQMELWQDGIGLVPDRDNERDPVRIEPGKLHKARELLVWALGRVAHGPAVWLDLESFLTELFRATKESPIDLYWIEFAWHPTFKKARNKNQLQQWGARELAWWLDQEGVWAANALMVTLHALGLVERSLRAADAADGCFRLTPLGRAVFGAPEAAAPEAPIAQKFVTVQPNFEVVAYLDGADAREVCTLSRFATRSSMSVGPVQTFTLRRDSVYRALESGMALDGIRTFLVEHGKTDLPANVLRGLLEWSGKRESLVLRTNLTVALGSPSKPNSGRVLREAGAVLLPAMAEKKARHDFPGWQILDHGGEFERVWDLDESGRVTVSHPTTVTEQRLTVLAEAGRNSHRITQRSIAAAREHGLTPDQMLEWLGAHARRPVPPVLELAIRNWTGRQSVSMSRVHLLRVSRAPAREALLSSAVLRPHLAGFVPPDWFVVREEHAREVRHFLESIGFSISEALDLSEPGQAQELPAAPTSTARIKRRRSTARED